MPDPAGPYWDMGAQPEGLPCPWSTWGWACSAQRRACGDPSQGSVNHVLRKMGLIPRDAPEATLTTIVFFAAVYLTAKALIALEHLQQ